MTMWELRMQPTQFAISLVGTSDRVWLIKSRQTTCIKLFFFSKSKYEYTSTGIYCLGSNTNIEGIYVVRHTALIYIRHIRHVVAIIAKQHSGVGTRQYESIHNSLGTSDGKKGDQLWQRRRAAAAWR